MIVGRRYVRPAELLGVESQRAWWPAASIAALCGLAVVLPPGVVTGMNLYLLGLVLLVAAFARKAPPSALVGLLLPFVALIVIGLMAGFHADRYLVLKDAWYVSNPAILIAVGFVLGHLVGDNARGLRAFVVGGTLVSLGHLLWFLIHPDLLNLRATTIRAISGTGYYATGLACLILAAHRGRWREELAVAPWVGGVCLLLCSASVVLSFSRTMILVIVFGSLAIGGFFRRSEWLRVGALLLAGTAAVLLLHAGLEAGLLGDKYSFAGKLARSLEELRPTEHMSIREINENWRGYETARALATWHAGNGLQWFVGQGFGAQVDLGLFQNLSRNPRDAVRFIPIFHNGYVFLLVKTGVVGVLLYLAAVIQAYLLGRREAGRPPTDSRRRQGRLLQGCAVILLITTWVIAGAFNKLDLFAVLLMIGFLVAALQRSDGRA